MFAPLFTAFIWEWCAVVTLCKYLDVSAHQTNHKTLNSSWGKTKSIANGLPFQSEAKETDVKMGLLRANKCRMSETNIAKRLNVQCFGCVSDIEEWNFFFKLKLFGKNAIFLMQTLKFSSFFHNNIRFLVLLNLLRLPNLESSFQMSTIYFKLSIFLGKKFGIATTECKFHRNNLIKPN